MTAMSQEKRQLDNYDNSRYLRLVDANVSVNPFGRNSVSDRAYKKTERLALATYLVTNHVSERESLRKNLRESAHSMLTLVAQSPDLFRNTEALTPVLLQVRTILTLLDLLFAAGCASEMNVSILKRAYTDFINFLNSSVGSEYSETASLQGIFDETQQKAEPVVLGGFTSKQEVVPRTAVRGGTSLLKKKKKKSKNTSLKSRAISTNRRVVILDMVAKTGKVTVKEVATQIPDTSPKTLQRELMNLVEEGTLKKEGNKRWTVYTLVRR